MSMPMPVIRQIRQKDRDAVLTALRAGVVPRVGQHLIQVGRARELSAMLTDIKRIAEGGSCFKLVIGDYGAGKTFFLNLCRAMSLEHKLVTMHADLNPDRRLQSSGGQARSLYQELVRNTATRAKSEGGALPGIVERFVGDARLQAKAEERKVEDVIHARLAPLSEMVGGFDMATVLIAYAEGFEHGDEVKKMNALRWLRGEFTTKTDARAALGVRTIIDDDQVYDALKLLSRFVRIAGFTGLVVVMDEMVNLLRITQSQTRNANFEQVLRYLNDSIQGTAEGIGFVLGGTPEFLLDTRRGLYSYQALQSRLATNQYTHQTGLQDFTGPLLRLSALTPEDFFVLLQNLTHVWAMGEKDKYLVPAEAIHAFLQQANQRLGEAYFRTPRTSIVAFLNLLATLEQNPGTDWKQLVRQIPIETDRGKELEQMANAAADPEPASTVAAAAGSTVVLSGSTPSPSGGADDDLTSFKL